MHVFGFMYVRFSTIVQHSFLNCFFVIYVFFFQSVCEIFLFISRFIKLNWVFCPFQSIQLKACQPCLPSENQFFLSLILCIFLFVAYTNYIGFHPKLDYFCLPTAFVLNFFLFFKFFKVHKKLCFISLF